VKHLKDMVVVKFRGDGGLMVKISKANIERFVLGGPHVNVSVVDPLSTLATWYSVKVPVSAGGGGGDDVAHGGGGRLSPMQQNEKPTSGAEEEKEKEKQVQSNPPMSFARNNHSSKRGRGSAGGGGGGGGGKARTMSPPRRRDNVASKSKGSEEAVSLAVEESQQEQGQGQGEGEEGDNDDEAKNNNNSNNNNNINNGNKSASFLPTSPIKQNLHGGEGLILPSNTSRPLGMPPPRSEAIIRAAIIKGRETVSSSTKFRNRKITDIEIALFSSPFGVPLVTDAMKRKGEEIKRERGIRDH